MQRDPFVVDLQGPVLAVKVNGASVDSVGHTTNAGAKELVEGILVVVQVFEMQDQVVGVLRFRSQERGDGRRAVSVGRNGRRHGKSK